ncbi:MAG TPA: hypothetical protein PLL79_07355 [Candidatus Cloacimonas acidaminovorans]|nr:hypothetical protein [Candidatus Cloacimonas acidaminovorans]
MKPVVNICRSSGTLFPNKYSFVGSFLFTGLKPVVNICLFYGTFFLYLLNEYGNNIHYFYWSSRVLTAKQI